MKKYYFLIVVALILGLVLAGCTLLSNIGQTPTSEQSGVSYLTKGVPPPDDLVALWHFDFDTGANDSTVNHNDGTFEGDANIIFAGYFGNAVSFDGDGDYVRVPGSDSLRALTSEITVEAWIMFSNISDAFYVRTPFDLSPKAWGLDRYGGELRFYIYDGTTPIICKKAWTPEKNQWYHIAGTYNGQILKLYVNKDLYQSLEYTGNINLTDQGVVIGARHSDGGWGYLHGLLDDIRIWKVALLPDQLGIIYDFGGFLPPVSLGKPFKMGSTIPIKFQLMDVQGAFITNALPSILPLELLSDGTPTGDVIPGDLSGAANTDSIFRYDPDSNQYIFNLATKGLTAPATYRITVDLGDGTTQQVNIGLK